MARKKRQRLSHSALNDSIKTIHELNLDVRRFTIYLTGEVTTYAADDADRAEPGVEYQMSARIIKNLQILADQDSRRPILIHMKTNGGDWNEGMAIYDAIKFAPNPITILNYTHARSMSSLIFQAADLRVMMPNSEFMYHEGTLAANDTNKGAITFIEWCKRYGPIMLSIYADRLKEKGEFSQLSKAAIKKMLQDRMDKRQEVFLTAQQAVDQNFADTIFDGNWTALRKISKRKPG